MKICIPTETDKGLDAPVYGHFGSAPFFTLVDTETGSVEILSNANQHHSHGMCQPLASLAGRTLDAVACSGMGGRAIQRLNEAGIKVFRVVPGTVREIAEHVRASRLTEMTADNACQGHGCH